MNLLFIRQVLRSRNGIFKEKNTKRKKNPRYDRHVYSIKDPLAHKELRGERSLGTKGREGRRDVSKV